MKYIKKWFWLVLLALATVVAVISTSGFVKQSQERVIYSITVGNSVPVKKDAETLRGEKPPMSTSSSSHQSLQEKVNADEEVATALQVSADKLFSHLQRLNFTRHTPPERARARTYITTELKKLGWKPRLEKFQDGVNVFAERPGTDKKAGAILLGAHYDTVVFSPGADDNASGVAVMLEIARLLGSRSTPKTLQLAFFDQEEAGLLGSKAFVKNPAHLQNLRGVIVMDMVGYACHSPGCQKYPKGLPIAPPSDKGDFLAVVGDAEHLPLLNAFQKVQSNPIAFSKEDKGIGKQGSREAGRDEGNQGNMGVNSTFFPLSPLSSTSSLPPVLTLPIPLKGLLTPDTLRSDHAPFWYQGVGAVLVTDTANLRTSHYHKPSDVPATIDREFFTGAAQIVLNSTTALLESSETLNTQLSTDTSTPPNS